VRGGSDSSNPSYRSEATDGHAGTTINLHGQRACRFPSSGLHRRAVARPSARPSNWLPGRRADVIGLNADGTLEEIDGGTGTHP
jgi:hypothetical protein